MKMTIEPLHIKLKKGQLAERVLVAGDPERVKQVSELLKDAKLVNDNRGFYVYTGLFNGKPVSLACHGVGAPSAAIVFEELYQYGAKVILRLGTAGGLLSGQRYGDLVIPSSAASNPGGTIGQYVKDICLAPAPDHDLVSALVREANREGLQYRVAPVFSSDAFYAEDPGFAQRLSSLGFAAVEMECATLFALGQMRGYRAAALLMISDNMIERTPMLDASQMRTYAQRAAKVALEALVSA
ncbi:MAG: purine-nucleoside phosphorylase [Thermoprotei archaeon]|jgi:5'-methylthioadenosine phosphorylase